MRLHRLILLAGLAATFHLVGARADSGEGLGIILTPAMMEACSTLLPARAPALRKDYDTWISRQSAQVASYLNSPMFVENVGKMRDGVIEKLRGRSPPELQESCDLLQAKLRNETPPADVRFGSPEATWRSFQMALSSSDRDGVMLCLEGHAKDNYRGRIQQMTPAELKNMADSIAGFALGSSYGEFQEAVITRKNGRAGIITFNKVGSNWKIVEL